MFIYKLKKIILVRIITIILIGGLILPDAALSMSSPLTSTLAVQSMFKLMVSLTKVNGEFLISEDEETLSKIQAGFQKDAEIQYFNLLKDRAKEIGLSQVGLKRFIKEHLTDFTFKDTPISEDAIRILTSIASFGHGNNNGTNVNGAIYNLLNKICVAGNGIKNNNSFFMELYRNQGQVYEGIREAFGWSMDVIKGASINPQDALSAKEKVKKVYSVVKSYREELERVEKLPGYSQREKEIIAGLFRVMDVVIVRLRDRIALMEGEVGDENLDLNDLKQEFFEYFGPKKKEENFEFIAPDYPVRIQGNKISLMSLFCNIANNSLKHAGKSKIKISFKIKQEAEQIVIEISDNGQGMTQEQLKSLWEPFYTTKGTGIGLTEAQLVVKDHGGTIEVDSLTEDLYKKLGIMKGLWSDPSWEGVDPAGVDTKHIIQENYPVIKEYIARFITVLEEVEENKNLSREDYEQLSEKVSCAAFFDANPSLNPSMHLSHILAHLVNPAAAFISYMGDEEQYDGQKEKFLRKLSTAKKEASKVITILEKVSKGGRTLQGTTFTIRLPIAEAEVGKREHLDNVTFDKQEGEKRVSLVKGFNSWDGIMAINGKDVTIFKTNASKFFPETPSDFVEGLKHFMKTGQFFPVRVDIDISNFCNNDCIMCFDRDFRVSHREKIPRDIVKNILDNLKNLGAKSIRFTGGGEPLTHPNFGEFVKYAHESGFKLSLETNGDMFTDDVIEVLARYMNHVRVSINSSCNASRRAVHRPKNSQNTFDSLMVKIEKLSRKRKELGRDDDLLLGATFLILPENHNEVDAFITEMKKIGVNWVAIRKITDHELYEQKPELLRTGLQQFETAKERESNQAFTIVGPYGVTHTPQQDFHKCLISATRFIVLANSTQSLCCLARNGLNLDQALLGKIGDGENPLTTLIEQNEEKITTFMNTAPSFCDFCIDSDFNHFLEIAWNILATSPETEFRRVRLSPYNEAKILIGERDISNGVTTVSMPNKHYEKIIQGNVLNVELSETTRNIQGEAEWGQTFIDTALIRAEEAKRLYAEGKIESPDILVGAETSWIPEEQLPYIQELLNKLSRLSKEKGLDNLIIKRRKGTRLASILRKEAEERGVPNSNVIILGDHSILDGKAFDSFREGVDPEKWAFFAGVELPENFPENNYIRLLEMLTNALNLWSGRPQPEDTPFMRIVQEGKRIYKFIIPEVEPMDYNLLKEIYAGQLKAMKSA